MDALGKSRSRSREKKLEGRGQRVEKEKRSRAELGSSRAVARPIAGLVTDEGRLRGEREDNRGREPAAKELGCKGADAVKNIKVIAEGWFGRL